MRAGFVAWLTAAAPLALAGRDDVVEFRGGNHLVGEAKYLERGKLCFKTDATDTITVEWNEVAALVTKQHRRVVQRDGTRYFGTLVPTELPATAKNDYGVTTGIGWSP